VWNGAKRLLNGGIMSDLRFVKRKVQPFDAGFPQYRYILQMLIPVAKDPSYGSAMEWQDVPVVDEEEGL